MKVVAYDGACGYVSCLVDHGDDGDDGYGGNWWQLILGRDGLWHCFGRSIFFNFHPAWCFNAMERGLSRYHLLGSGRNNWHFEFSLTLVPGVATSIYGFVVIRWIFLSMMEVVSTDSQAFSNICA